METQLRQQSQASFLFVEIIIGAFIRKEKDLKENFSFLQEIKMEDIRFAEVLKLKTSKKVKKIQVAFLLLLPINYFC
jgi:hypothetical protein